jgi:hypothetical protein
VPENPSELRRAEGFEDAGGEEGLVVLQTEQRDEGEARQKEKNTRRRRGRI